MILWCPCLLLPWSVVVCFEGPTWLIGTSTVAWITSLSHLSLIPWLVDLGCSIPYAAVHLVLMNPLLNISIRLFVASWSLVWQCLLSLDSSHIDPNWIWGLNCRCWPSCVSNHWEHPTLKSFLLLLLLLIGALPVHCTYLLLLSHPSML